MPPTTRQCKRKNAGNLNNASNSSFSTPLDTVNVNSVNSTISKVVPNLTSQATQIVPEQLQQTSNVGNTMPTSSWSTVPNPEAAGNAATTQAGIHVWLERFMKQNPRVFTKAATSSVAKDWVSHIEEIFTIIGVDPRYKSKLAAYRLEEEAQDWWKFLLQENGGGRFEETLPWKGFRTIFFKKYCSNMDIEMYKRQYHLIRQRNGEPLNNFNGKFYRLVACLGKDAGPPEEQAEKYQWAVCKRIRKVIINSTFSTVEEAVNAAKKVDKERNERMAKPDVSRKIKRDGNHFQATRLSWQINQSSGKPRKVKGKKKVRINPTTFQSVMQFNGKLYYDGRGEVPLSESNEKGADNSQKGKRIRDDDQDPVEKKGDLCLKCQKKHSIESKLGTNLCFRCGKSSHDHRDCSNSKKCHNCGAIGHMIKNCKKPKT